MKKYLIRAGMLPNEHYDVVQFIKKNTMGGNVGNLLYANSIIRNLTTDKEVEFVSTNYKVHDLDADFINENYDAFCIPLADAFRKDFVPELDGLTKIVSKLNIPCYVMGAGIRDTYEPTFMDGFDYDENVKAFVSAVLEKSSIIGVRGQITSDYLSHLGFREGIDHMPIGCPSMYTFGPHLSVNEPHITTSSRISVNASSNAQMVIQNLVRKTVAEIRDYTFIPQTRNELKYMYTGAPYKVGKEHIQIYADSELFVDNHIKFFINIKSWLDYFKDVELSFGSRLHGNVAALLAGTPAIFIAKDARERELNELHHFNSFPVVDLTDDTTIWDLIEKSDFKGFEKYQMENYNNFKKFLEYNNIEYFDQTKGKKAPYDKLIKDTVIEPPVESFRTVNEYERGERLYEVFAYTYRRKRKQKPAAETDNPAAPENAANASNAENTAPETVKAAPQDTPKETDSVEKSDDKNSAGKRESGFFGLFGKKKN